MSEVSEGLNQYCTSVFINVVMEDHEIREGNADIPGHEMY